MNSLRCHFLVAVLLGLLCIAAAAQQNVPDRQSADAAKNKGEQEKQVQRKEQSQRLLGIIPQFGVTSRQNAAPLTAAEKFHLFRKSAFDPIEFGLVGLQAGIEQASDSFSGYGQGAEGYGKRYGATLADEVSSGFFSNFLYPSLLKQDPRYFRLGEGRIKHRIGYAIAHEFVTRTDAGGQSFNFSNALGAVSAGGLSNAYYPASDRGFGLTMSRAAISLGYGALGNLVDEFYPDVTRWVFRKREKKADHEEGELPNLKSP